MAQDHVPYEEDFRKIVGIDPAANWLLNVARTDYLPEGGETPIPILFEIGGDERNAMLGMLFAHAGASRPPLTARIFPDHLPLVVPLDFFVRSSRQPGQRGPSRLSETSASSCRTRTRLALEGPVPDETTLTRPEPRTWPPGTVFVAVIDDGIAFAHERFLDANGAADRGLLGHEPLVANLPRSPAPAVPRAPARQPPVPAVPGGGRAVRSRIDAWLPAGAGGEDEIYASSGLINHARPRHKSAAWRAAHGTHVLDLAAGYDPAGPIPDRPIIAVQLPTPVVAQTTGELLDFHVALATYYILDRVWRLSENRPPPPVVINTSFGYIAGPHDGTGLVESLLRVRDGP